MGPRSNDFLKRYIKSPSAFIDADFARHVDEALGLLGVVGLMGFACWHDARLISFWRTRQAAHNGTLVAIDSRDRWVQCQSRTVVLPKTKRTT